MRIAFFGGTFDPPHRGHIAIARAAITRLGLDQVLVAPVATQPLKGGSGHSSFEDRLAMVRAAVEGIEGAEASSIELDRGGPSYTVETVEELVRLALASGAPPPDPFLIVGADVVDTLPTWHRVEDLARLVTLVVVGRPGVEAPTELDSWRLEVVGGTGVDVSSSEVRSLVADGQPIKGLVPGAVEHCIRRRGLYAVPR